MVTIDLAAELLEQAAVNQQVAHRIAPREDVPQVRSDIRKLARERSIRIRTAVLGDVLAVVRADADIWTDPTITMVAKLTPQ